MCIVLDKDDYSEIKEFSLEMSAMTSLFLMENIYQQFSLKTKLIIPRPKWFWKTEW